MSKFLFGLVILAAGIGIGVVANREYGAHTMQHPTSESTQREPLYWVAPMDPDYRHDGPGKSPMGMDLVPVYAEAADADAAGTVRISPDVENNLGVRTAMATHRKLPRTIRTVGTVGFDEDKLHHIHIRVQGWIEKLGVTSAGDPVKRGQELFELYSPELVTAQEELLIALRTRDRELRDAARERLVSLGFEQQQLKSLEQTRNVMRTVVFYSDVDGYLSHLNVRHGMYVQPKTEIMSIGQLDSVWVIAEVPERQSALLASGQAVKLRFDVHPGRVWQGKIDYVYPVLEPVTRTARVRIRVNNSDGALSPNMYASVEIAAGESRPVLSIPASAVIHTGTMQRVVRALGNGRYLATQVRIGRRAGDWVEILDGLSDGDEVVTSAQFLLDSESSRNAEFERMGSRETAGDSHAGHVGHMQHEPVEETGIKRHSDPGSLDPHAHHRSSERIDPMPHAPHESEDPHAHHRVSGDAQ